MQEDPPEDTPRRIRAAMGYADAKRVDVAKAVGYSEATLDRMMGRRSGPARHASWSDLWKIADCCGVPREWFSCEIDRLWEIVPEGRPVFVRPARRRAAADASRLAEAAARRQRDSEQRTGEAPERPDARTGRS